MKINKIHIDGFGKWQNCELEFGNALQIVYGANEAGKSTLARFITSILFGFANGHQPYQQYLPKNGAAYGGWLTVTYGQQNYRLQRTKGKNGGKLTITTTEGDKVPNSLLDRMLGTIDQSLYEAVYSFSQQGLNDVFALTKEDLQTRLQRMGAVGSNQWLTEVKILDKQADELYKQRGRKPEINVKLNEYRELTDKIRQAAGNYDHYHELLAEVDQLSDQVAKNVQQLSSLKPTLEHQQELIRLWPTYQRLESIKTNDDNATISNETVTKVQTLRADLKETSRQLDQITASDRADTDGSTLTKQQTFYFDNLDRFTRLKDEGTKLTFQLEQQPQLRASQTNWQGEQRQLQERYGQQPLPESLSSPQRDQLETLMQQFNDGRLTRSTQSQNTNYSVLLVQVVIALIGLLILGTGSGGLIKLVGVLLIAGAGWWAYQGRSNQNKQQNTKQTDSHVTKELKQFGNEHGLAPFAQDQWLSMQGDLHRNEELSRQLSQVTRQLSRIDQLVDQYLQQADFASQMIDLTKEPAIIIRQVNDFIIAAQSARDLWQRRQQQRRVLAEQRERVSEHQQQINSQLQTIYQQYDLATDQDFDRYYDRSLQMVSAREKASALASQLTNQQQSQLAQYHQLEDLQTQVDNTRDQVNRLQIETEAKRQNITRNRLEADHLAQNGTLTYLRQKQANLQEEINELVSQWLTVRLTAKWIDRALQLATADRFPQILTKAQEYFELLTMHHYTEIRFDGDLIQVLDDQGGLFDVGELSQGTAEQLYVALRLGYANVMSRDINLPILIDDGFVNFDRDRRDQVFELLHQLSEHNQIIYFTADKEILTKTESEKIINLDELRVS